MRAALLTEFNKPLEIKDVEVPKVGKGEVLLQVLACGICRSDWHLWRGDPSLVAYMQWSGGKLPIIPGHEVAGRVVEVGEGVSNVKVGDVVVAPASSTGDNRTCRYCKEGASNICEHLWIPGFGTHGCYAEYMKVPASSVVDLVKVPQGVPPEYAAITGCGFGTAWNALVVKNGIRPGETLLITGAGGMGLSALLIASAAGAKTVVVDVNPASVEKAKKMGATAAYHYSGDPQELAKLVNEEIVKSFGMVDAVFDSTGNPDVLSVVLPAVRPQGRILLAGLMMKGKEIWPLASDIVVARELTIQGVLMLPSQRYDGIFKLMSEGRVNLESVIYRRISLDEVNDAYAEMSRFKNAGRFVITKFK
ncbi:zinc-dependent alcohol dehydrogenase family protein [Pyrobaculum aerophilum]|uniref:Alcohol dehydrogenase n=1 Tax=Pyrobaculum aerophilum TaxID=13773 RepID=A0A371R5J2_9CREN|nr:zinc-dependent alcohol dehydrogenase family protein [Pyrobaculum aerophilum]RFA97589.1 alcohol dehydrogenase [Pyrobaculum aerophilum]RFA99344.1 alcohol dehydrogenase [Pyrobaculum aerophilum]